MGLPLRFCLLVLLLSLLLASHGGFAQTKTQAKTKQRKPALSAESPTRWPIQKITIEGATRLPADRIAALTGLKVGQVAGKEDFDAARDRLIGSGMFETVGYQFAPSSKGQGYDASFQIVEIRQVYPVRFEALSVPDDEIQAYLKANNPLYAPLLPGTRPVLDQYARQIETFLASKNRPDKVVGELIAVAAGQFEILFRSGATLPAISEVSFEGNEAVPSTELQHAISGVAFGVPFTKQGFQQLLDNQIRPLYDAKGLIRVSFPKVTTQPATKVKGVDVHVVIKEGPVYKLGKVTLTGAPASESVSLMKTAAIKTGDTANFDEVNQGVERLTKVLKHDGYLRASAEIERKIDDAKKIVDVMLKVEPGAQYLFGKLTIEGLDLNGEPAVRKLWAIKPGAPYDVNYPNYFIERVREDGYFDNLGDTKAYPEIHEETHTVDVTLKFAAGPPAKDHRRRPPVQ